MPTQSQSSKSSSGQKELDVARWLSSSQPLRIGPTRSRPRLKTGSGCLLAAAYWAGVRSPCGSCQNATAVGSRNDASLVAASLATASY
jgi:hypothetical protein